MTVKELIQELLEFDLDLEVEVNLNTDDGEYYNDFEIGWNRYSGVFFSVDFKGDTLVNTDTLEELQELEDEMNG